MAMNSTNNNGNNGGFNGPNAMPIYAAGRFTCEKGPAAGALSIRPAGYMVDIQIAPVMNNGQQNANGKVAYDMKNAVHAYVPMENIPTLIAATDAVVNHAYDDNLGCACSNRKTETIISIGKGSSFPNEPGITENADKTYLRIMSYDGSGNRAFFEFGEAPDMIAGLDRTSGKWHKEPVASIPGHGDHDVKAFQKQLELIEDYKYGVQSCIFAYDFKQVTNEIKGIAEKSGVASGGYGNGGGRKSSFEGNASDGYTSNYSSSALDLDDM